eukprot:1126963-Prorocentrum_minimum.AAC.6
MGTGLSSSSIRRIREVHGYTQAVCLELELELSPALGQPSRNDKETPKETPHMTRFVSTIRAKRCPTGGSEGNPARARGEEGQEAGGQWRLSKPGEKALAYLWRALLRKARRIGVWAPAGTTKGGTGDEP